MAESLDPSDLVTIEELAISNVWDSAALVDLVERKGSYGERFSSNGCEVRPSCTQYQRLRNAPTAVPL